MELKLVTVEDIEEIRGALLEASFGRHKNSKNYEFDAMCRRWSRYHFFQALYEDRDVIAFSGVYSYGHGQARVCDRTWVRTSHRNQLLRGREDMIRPVIDYFLPSQTQYCLNNRVTPFVSIQVPAKLEVMRRMIRETGLPYVILPDEYFTCHHNNYSSATCWQRIMSIGEVNLPTRLAVNKII